jgi:hypothetical protein
MNCLITKYNNSLSVQFDEWVNLAEIIIESKTNHQNPPVFKMEQSNFYQINLEKFQIQNKISVEIRINNVLIDRKIFE